MICILLSNKAAFKLLPETPMEMRQNQVPQLNLSQLIQTEEVVLKAAIDACSNDDYRSISDDTIRKIATQNVNTLGCNTPPQNSET